jgi:hypothetical protein
MGIWLRDYRSLASSTGAAVIGHLAWNGHAATLPLSFGFLILVLLQANRWAAYAVAVAYYGASTLPLIPGANAFLMRTLDRLRVWFCGPPQVCFYPSPRGFSTSEHRELVSGQHRSPC